MSSDTHNHKQLSEKEMAEQFRAAMNCFPSEFMNVVKPIFQQKGLSDTLENRIMVLVMLAGKILRKMMNTDDDSNESDNLGVLTIGVQPSKDDETKLDAVAVFDIKDKARLVKLIYREGRWLLSKNSGTMTPAEFSEHIDKCTERDGGVPVAMAVARKLLMMLDLLGSNDSAEVGQLVEDVRDALASVATDTSHH